MEIQASAPHFFVSDLMRSLDYYCDVLEFERPNTWGDPPVFAMPRHGNFMVMLNQGARFAPNPNGRDEQWDAYFWCNETAAYFERVKAAGARIVHGPVERPEYGMREFAVLDPDGYMLVFAEDMHPDGD